MLDVVGAIVASVLCATVIGTLMGMPPLRPQTRLAVFCCALIWLAVVVALAASGNLAPGAFGPLPANLLPFTTTMAVLFGGWFFLPQFRAAVLSVPLPVLVGLNAGRIGGVFFLILEAQGRLSAPFATAAGVGDMIAGALALPLAAMVALGMRIRGFWLRGWNAFGAADLVVAISIGLLSAPGTPFRVFTDGPGTVAMTTAPWVLVPAMLVPLFLLIHTAIAAKLRLANQDQKHRPAFA